MAKIKMAHIIAEARGKIGGTVFSRNTYGAYIRAKVTPVNPSSGYQQGVRAFMADCAQSWRGITAAQRVSWNAVAGDWTNINIFGDQENLTGYNLYMKLNRNRLSLGAAKISDAPASAAVVNFIELSVVIDTTGGTLNATFAPVTPINQNTLVYMTAPVSPGVDFVKSEYRLIGKIVNADVSPVDFRIKYITKFGAMPPVGQKAFIRFLPILHASGQPGTYKSAFAIAI